MTSSYLFSDNDDDVVWLLGHAIFRVCFPESTLVY
jgi:hypothetical protein